MSVKVLILMRNEFQYISASLTNEEQNGRVPNFRQIRTHLLEIRNRLPR